MLSQLTQIKSDPLDVLLFAVGLRLTQLAKMGDDKFKGLLENRNFTIQLSSDAEQTSRYYEINNGTFSQYAGPAKEPTLTITFKDSMTGVKLLTKGEATAFMTGIQNGDLKMSGDYSLLMWFNQVAKFIVPKVPEPLKPVVEQAKPLIEKATPFAKELCSKALAMIGGASAGKASGSSKYFNESNTKDVNADSDTQATSKLDTLKAKAAEIKDDAMEKLDELKNEAKEKVSEAKDKVEQAKQTLTDETTSDSDASDNKAIEEKYEAAKDTINDKDSTADDDSIRPDNVFAKSADNDNLTPALRKSAEIEAKHASDEVIADNVKTSAVSDDKSPITNISITRSDSAKDK